MNVVHLKGILSCQLLQHNIYIPITRTRIGEPHRLRRTDIQGNGQQQSRLFGWHHNFASLLCNRRTRTRNPSDKGFDFPDDRIYCEHMYRPPPPLACMLLLLLRSVTCPRVLAAEPHPPTDLLYWQRHEQDECKRGVL